MSRQRESQSLTGLAGSRDRCAVLAGATRAIRVRKSGEVTSFETVVVDVGYDGFRLHVWRALTVGDELMVTLALTEGELVTFLATVDRVTADGAEGFHVDGRFGTLSETARRGIEALTAAAAPPAATPQAALLPRTGRKSAATGSCAAQLPRSANVLAIPLPV